MDHENATPNAMPYGGAPLRWRLQILDWGSLVSAIGGTLVAATTILQGSLAGAPILRASILLLLLPMTFASAWRSAPYRRRVLLLVCSLFLAHAIVVFQVGFVLAAVWLGTSGVVLAGLLLGVPYAIGGWLLSTLVCFGAALAIGNAWVPFSFDLAATDPRQLGNGLRLSILYATFNAVLAIGVSVLVSRLLASLDESRRSLAELTAAQVERDRAEENLHTSEARWRSVVDHAPDVISILNREHQIVFRNRTGLELQDSKILGVAVEELVAPRFRDALYDIVEGVFETGRAATLDTESQLENQEPHFFTTRFGALKVDGVVDRVTLISREVTQQRRLEGELRQSQKLEAVGQLTGGVAHDFNNLLTIMMGNLELVEQQLTDAGVETEFAVYATEAANRAAGLTHRLLAFSRRQALRPQVVNLSRLVEGMDDLLRRSLGEAIEIECSSDSELWNCEVDPAEFENLILNLAINARDAMPKGGKLTIDTRNAVLDPDYTQRYKDLQPGLYVSLAVSDTGCGMSKEVRDCAFDPFFTTKQAASGSGLGLSMVYGLVKQSKGHVSIYSEEREGTTVKVYLPRVASSAAPADLGATTPTQVCGKGELILLVEDDEGVRRLATRMLSDLGYRSYEAGDAEEALRRLAAVPDTDLLLTDVILPGGMSGADLAKKAVDLCPGLRVVFCSGYTENAIIHHGRLDPGVDLLEKPFTQAELGKILALSLSRGEKENGGDRETHA